MPLTATIRTSRVRRLKAADVPAIKWDLVMGDYFLLPNGMIVDALEGDELGQLDGEGGVVWRD